MKKILTSNGKPLFKDGKLLASSRGSGSATVTTRVGWQCTQVPNSGYVDKVYFNTNLSVEEVVNILDKITMGSVLDVPGYIMLYSATLNLHIGVLKQENKYVISTLLKGDIIFHNDVEDSKGTEFVGWNPNITYFDINSELSQGTETSPVGYQNDKLSSLFSTTPFVEVQEKVTLTGDYDGNPVITDIVGGWEGTAVPNTGYVENIYFNTDLSVDEVVEKLKTLRYTPDDNSENPSGHILLKKESSSYGIYAFNKDDKYLLYYGMSTPLFHNFPEGSTDATNQGFPAGWNPEITYPFSIKDNVVNQLETHNVGAQNGELTSLFSITPFTYKENNTIDMKPYINEKKLPLKIRVDGPKVVSGGDSVSGTPIPSSGYIENIYVNVNTEPEELANKLNELLAGVGIDPAEGFTFPLFTNEDETIFGSLFVDEGAYGLVIFIGETPIVPYVYTKDSTKEAEIIAEFGFVGWNPTLTDGIVPVNAAIIDISILLEDYFAMWEMAVNEITPFISSTPFVSSGDKETIELSGEYDGNTLVVNNLPKGKNIGTTVPNNEYVGKIYINPNLTIDDLRENLKKLEWVKNDFDFDYLYTVLKTDKGGLAISTGGNPNGQEDLDSINSFAIYCIINDNPICAGIFPRDWQPNAETPMPNVLSINDFPLTEFESGLQGEEYIVKSGHQNYLLSSLFSVTPYSEEEQNTINIKSLLENHKLPLKIKVNASNAVEVVSEFPTTDVAPDIIYKVDKITVSKIYLAIPSEGIILNLNDNANGVYDVDVLPDNMKITGDEGTYVYVCGDYAYVKIINKDTNEEQISTVGEMYTAMGLKLPDKGSVKTVEEITENGVYVIKGGQTTLQGVKGETYNYINNEWYNFKKIFEQINDGSISDIDNIDFGFIIKEYLFSNCSNLRNINSNKIKRIGTKTFNSCDNLTTVSLPNCVEIGHGAFTYCQSLSSVNVPNCKRIWGGAFQWCSGLKTIELPYITEFGDTDAYNYDYTFEGTDLIEVYLPSCHTLRYRTFAICQSLVSVKLPVCINLGEETFDHCYALTDLYLGKRPTVHENTFKDLHDPVKVHIRESMVNEYQNDSDWKSLVDAGKVILVGDYTD